MHITRCLLNFILPPRCICCGEILKDENGLCPECFNQMTFISEPYCQHCGLPFSETMKPNKHMLCPDCVKNKKSVLRMCRSALKYDDLSKRAILALKFMDKTENANVFAKWLQLAGKDIFSHDADTLIPVPLHYRRLIHRRYNQSALVASELSRLTGLNLDTSSLIKHKSTKPQVSFSGSQRLNNVKGAFSVKFPERIVGRHVVVIDDVYTTGSTIRECAIALHEAGAASVDALTIARVYY